MNKHRFTDQGSHVEATVVQMFNQGTIRKKGCNLFPGPFFVSFLDDLSRSFGKQKRKEKYYRAKRKILFCRKFHLDRNTSRLIPAAGIKGAAIAIILVAVLTCYLEDAHAGLF